MSRELSLFADYTSKENQTTNHCGLILKLLYRDNPEGFSRFLDDLCGAELEAGIKFEQQKSSKKSIPDLIIQQKSFHIVVETKTTDWFKEDQLKRHLEAFDSPGLNVLLALCKFEGKDYEAEFMVKFPVFVEEAKRRKVQIKVIGFDDLLDSVKEVETSSAFKQMLSEFEEYLDRNGLLPAWERTLDVVPCSSTLADAVTFNAYFCPHVPGSYSHRRAKWMGLYSQKGVRFVGRIKAVISLTVCGGEAEVLTRLVDDPEETLIQEARVAMEGYRERVNLNGNVVWQVFVFDGLERTDFIKDTAGGLLGKRYFDVGGLDPQDTEDLAKKLNNKNWSELPRI